jgi:N-acetylmuramoyl-L-alanine amidase
LRLFRPAALLGILALLPLQAVPALAQKPPRTAPALTSGFQKAQAAHAQLKKSKRRMDQRQNWLNVIDQYRLLFEVDAGAPEADAAMYAVSQLYRDLFKVSRLSTDQDMALYYLRRLAKSYPTSPLADDALFDSGEILLSRKAPVEQTYVPFERIVDEYPRGDRYRDAAVMVSRLRKQMPAAVERPADAAKPPAPDPGPAGSPAPSPDGTSRMPPRSSPAPGGRPGNTVNSLRHWSDPTYTRVVIDVGQPSKFTHNRLVEHDLPRLYIDIFNTSVGAKLARPLSIGDGLLQQARVGQFTDDTVRVVLDLKRMVDYKIFTLNDPFRIVVDITAGNGKATSVALAPGSLYNSSRPAPSPGLELPPTLAQQLGLRFRRIVLDPGHGGHDPGAIGVDGLQEKEIALDIAMRLRRILMDELDLDVVMTRDADVFVPLEERTAIANTAKADIFLSIHCNSSRRSRLRGIETFFLNLASSREAAETAALENMSTVARVADFEKTMLDLLMSMKMDESSRLAQVIQSELYTKVRKSHKDSVNLGVKQAPFVVLIGARMPSVLSEVSFINHPVEGKRLALEEYRDLIAASLASGIKRYIGSLNQVPAR